MLAHAIDNAAPSTIVLISGDRDFAYALSILRFRHYRIVLITHPDAHQSLRAQASISFDWVSEVLEPVDPTLSNQPSPQARRGKISSPPAHDKFFSGSTGHNPPSSLFQESYDEKSANNANDLQDETRCSEIPRTLSKRKHDSLPPCSKRLLAASSMDLNNGPETPARVVHSSVASCYTYPNESLKTPFATTPCSSESKFSSKTTLSLPRPSQALQKSRIMGASCHLDLLCENSPLSHQQGSLSPINATQRLSSIDRMAVDDNHPGPTPTLIPPSTLSTAIVSATSQISADPRQPTSITDPMKFKILIQCLKLHRSTGICRPLRSKIGLEINQNGTTYRKAGVLKFSEYIEMAKTAGIVDLGGVGGAAWVALREPWYNAPIS